MPNNSRIHTANANLILDVLADGQLNVPEISALTGLNQRVVRRNIRGLRDADFVVTTVTDEADRPLWERTARKVRAPRKAKAPAVTA